MELPQYGQDCAYQQNEKTRGRTIARRLDWITTGRQTGAAFFRDRVNHALACSRSVRNFDPRAGEHAQPLEPMQKRHDYTVADFEIFKKFQATADLKTSQRFGRFGKIFQDFGGWEFLFCGDPHITRYSITEQTRQITSTNKRESRRRRASSDAAAAGSSFWSVSRRRAFSDSNQPTRPASVRASSCADCNSRTRSDTPGLSGRADFRRGLTAPGFRGLGRLSARTSQDAVCGSFRAITEPPAAQRRTARAVTERYAAARSIDHQSAEPFPPDSADWTIDAEGLPSKFSDITRTQHPYCIYRREPRRTQPRSRGKKERQAMNCQPAVEKFAGKIKSAMASQEFIDAIGRILALPARTVQDIRAEVSKLIDIELALMYPPNESEHER